MFAVALGLACAVAYGASDFVAGLMSRRLHFAVVGTIAQLAAMLAIFAVLPFAGGTPTAQGLWWGALSGVGSGVGSIALYRGLGNGRMNVVAPISAAGSAIIPVAVGLLDGERPSALTLVGVVLVLPAVALISMTGGGGRLADGALDGLLAGAGFGLLFVALARAGDGTGLWPTASGGVVAFLLLAVFLLAVRHRGALVAGSAGAGEPARGTGSAGRRTSPQAGAGEPVRGTASDGRRTSPQAGAVVAGLLGAVATTSYLLATREGLLVVVAVLAALYPGVTVALARLVLRETASRLQLGGLALAVAGVVAIALG